jgi:VIT1/CCC1 family predicted Fe2+/Mn2+ transporter
LSKGLIEGVDVFINGFLTILSATLVSTGLAVTCIAVAGVVTGVEGIVFG